MVEIAITGAFLLLALAFIGYPLLGTKEVVAQRQGADNSQLEALIAQRNALYMTIKELEFDREAGSLSEEDYRELFQRYTRKALALLKTIDQLQSGLSQGGTDIDEWIEREVLAARRPQVLVPVGQELRKVNLCPRCNSHYEEGDVFCATCGFKLAMAPGELRCQRCGSPYEEGDKFCARCGADLSPTEPR